jgi:putative membrane protein
MMCTALPSMMGGMGAAMVLWGVLWLAFLLLAGVGLFWALRALSRRSNNRFSQPDAPSEILRRRYATGEIDEDEYLRRLSGISQQ